ncbi:hypothetical protein DID76_04740, partial [Candidatus Marinamargulisbacteria bacterium SCGC AG-414-C22]
MMQPLVFSKINVLPKQPLNKGQIGQYFDNKGINTFLDAALFIQQLPYGRNLKRDDYMAVLIEQKGTCTTKHCLLTALAFENQIPLSLYTGLFLMTAKNTPQITSVLTHYNLNQIP